MASGRLRRFNRILRVGLWILLAGVAAEAALRAAGQLYLRGLYTTAFRSLDPLPGDVNVVCLGESSTAGLGVEPADSYPSQLERLLREFYDEPRIRTIVPPHVGQNTSQIANRIGDYLDLYRPRLVVVMTGYNNEWSLAESHVTRFLEGPPAETWRVRALVFLDRFRLFKLLRYGYLRFLARERSPYMAENAQYVWGHPELVRFPPAAWIHEFASHHSLAFVRAWREDIGAIVRASRERGSRVLLMTYHANPSYLPATEFASLAADLQVPLVRNDESFEALSSRQDPSRYMLDDGWHPNRLGYEVIARNAFGTIRDADLLGLTSAPSAPRAAPRTTRVLPASGRIEIGAPAGDPWLGRGWSFPEGWQHGAFRWTDGPRADVHFRLAEPGPRVLRLVLEPFLVADRLERQRVFVEANGRAVATLELSEPAALEHAVALPHEALTHDNLVSLHLPDAASPVSLGIGNDPRQLAIAVARLGLEGYPRLGTGDRVEPGRAEATPFLGPGWGEAEAGARWAEVPRAQIFFACPMRGQRRVVVTLAGLRGDLGLAGLPIGIRWNGETLATLRLNQRDVFPARFAFELDPTRVTLDNVLWIELHDDSRESRARTELPPAVAVASVELQRIAVGAAR